jgi:leucyl-tRNA synthetase
MDDFKPTGTGEPPLAKAVEWVRYSEAAQRETNTMPQWAGSCWYYLRFCDPRNGERFASEEAESYWMSANRESIPQPRDENRESEGGVDLYVGGTEHAVLHLLYARFWHKVLFDLGFVSTPEPFQRLVNQGIILGTDGQKMSKSRGNVVNPDEVIAEYGADSLRLYEMFMGPLEQGKPWSMKGVEGVFRFLARVWRLAFEENQEGAWVLSPALDECDFTAKQARVVHETIKKVSADVESLSFNTAIAQMMIFVNEFTSASPRPLEALRVLLRLLSPFAPHIAEEMWTRLGFPGDASRQDWPVHDEKFLVEDDVELLVQVNGKPCVRVTVRKTMPVSEIEALALADAKVVETIAGRAIAKVIVVPGKLVNVVAK